MARTYRGITGAMPVGLWKALLLLLGALTAAIILLFAMRSPLLFGPDEVGTTTLLGDRLEAEPVMFSARQLVRALAPASPLASAGVRVGDLVEFDHWYISLENQPGAAVGLTIWSQGVQRHAVMRTAAKRLADVPDQRSCYLALAYMMAGWIFGIVVGCRQSGGTAYRALALAFLATIPNAISVLAIGSGDHAISRVLNALSQWGIWCGPLIFAINYPANRPTGVRARLAAWMPAIHAIMLFATVLLIARDADFYVGLDSGTFAVLYGLMLFAIVCALWEGQRAAEGIQRQRFNWVLSAFSAKLGVGMGAWVAAVLLSVQGYMYYHELAVLVQLASYIAIVYATLRYRIFDFGLAVNRALVYSTTSLGILVSFGVIEWSADQLLHFEGREKSAWIDGAIALAVYLVFHKAHHRVEHSIERLFFRRWHHNEQLLRTFVRRAQHVSSALRLVEIFASEVMRFSGGAACALYRESREAGYALVYSLGDSLGPARIDHDDDVAIALRADASAIACGDLAHRSLTGVWALPMLHRGELLGFVVIGAKPDGGAYRADEIELLSFATRQIGLDLDALRVLELEQGMTVLEQRLRLLEDDLAPRHVSGERVAGAL